MSRNKVVIQFFISLLILSFGSCSTYKHTNTSSKPSKLLINSDLLKESFTGLVVYDPEKHENLIEYNDNHYFTPASNTKLMTFYTGLQVFKDSIPGIEYCLSGDTLYFGGTGDPTFLNRSFPNQPVFDRLKTSPHHLAYFHNIFEDKKFGPGWSWDDYPYYYSPEKAVFPIYGNVVHIKSSTVLGNHKISPAFFMDSITFSRDSLLDGIESSRLENDNIFSITYPEHTQEIDEEIPFRYSEKLLIRLLEDTLKRNIAFIKNKPHCKTRIMYSQPIDTVFRQMLLVSDNLIAEQILLMGSYTLFDTLNSTKMIGHIRQNHLPELDTGSRWVDGSGLSRYNQFTPSDMVMVLSKLYRELPTKKLFSLMPHGTDISIFENLSDEDNPSLIAKTGSMSYVYNLSGFLLTHSGKVLIFSFMNNNFTVSNKMIKKEMIKILKAYRDKY